MLFEFGDVNSDEAAARTASDAALDRSDENEFALEKADDDA